MLGVPGAANASGGPAVSVRPQNGDVLEFVNQYLIPFDFCPLREALTYNHAAESNQKVSFFSSCLINLNSLPEEDSNTALAYLLLVSQEDVAFAQVVP